MKAFKAEWYESRFKGSTCCGVILIADSKEEAIKMVFEKYGNRIVGYDIEDLKEGRSISEMNWGQMHYYSN